ncbi:RNA polymerase factor sigma-54 [Bacillus aquiflavi]|uniref:RNA polymerase factor sigma-54 n=1 Tax=Bacillus aquiflavi TaxID=2672567 RepID=A0A6B3W069_9BACI|nr:RNA polymerase factor sigma-54 [Bacillus aquiflavi]MBA4537066.1 RNA polymerase factor sigma-54 [Bacillus aquiflavi]NEY81363.1 RNA polymerase factor sigma-54 [Bacillus aquiflavi]UAC47807.1 RNA polymerase factor sigma-54 [Bacillus aquiflavi]
MNLKVGLWQQQTLKLAMTQELTQAIALLQYSSQELTAFLENKALENPLIELNASNVKTMDPRYDIVRKKNKKARKDETNWIEQIAGEKSVTLSEHLLSQLHLTSIDLYHRKIMIQLIQNLDENGYLRATEGEISNRASVPIEMVEDTIKLLQQLEPAGIGARSLQECLLLQIKRSKEANKLAEQIISDYFIPFAEKRWKVLAKELQVSLIDIQNVFDFVQTLNPKPGAIFHHEKAAYIIPEVIIDWDGADFLVKVFDEAIPKISFNHDYYQQFSARQDHQVNRFLQEKSQDYQWILKSIQQRNETLIKVVMKIVEKQSEFFQNGQGKLKPMTMKEISEELDIHESTVSRAVREKYAQTPFGTFELKSFFTSTIKTTLNENTSSAEVKNKISFIIEQEDKRKPLSDQRIADILKEQERMVVSRRTIAKYREQLGIPSSSKRKRYE